MDTPNDDFVDKTIYLALRNKKKRADYRRFQRLFGLAYSCRLCKYKIGERVDFELLSDDAYTALITRDARKWINLKACKKKKEKRENYGLTPVILERLIRNFKIVSFQYKNGYPAIMELESGLFLLLAPRAEQHNLWDRRFK